MEKTKRKSEKQEDKQSIILNGKRRLIYKQKKSLENGYQE